MDRFYGVLGGGIGMAFAFAVLGGMALSLLGGDYVEAGVVVVLAVVGFVVGAGRALRGKYGSA